MMYDIKIYLLRLIGISLIEAMTEVAPEASQSDQPWLSAAAAGAGGG